MGDPHVEGPSVSVIVAAYTQRRLEHITAGLTAVTGGTRRPDELVLVIDNNTDLAAHARTALAAQFPGLRVIEHTGPNGCGPARNTGASHATGQLLVFLDDDAVPRHDWLERLVAPFEQAEVVITGGRAVAAWPDSRRPTWFPHAFDWVVGCSHEGLPERTTRVRNVWGVALAVRSVVFAELGGFTSSLGRVGTTPLGCEDTELCIRAAALGQVVYVPAATADHHVAPARARWRYLWARCHAEGISKALVADLVGADSALADERSHVTRTLPRVALRGLADAARGEMSGLGRTFAVTTGVACAAVGYATALTRRHRQ